MKAFHLLLFDGSLIFPECILIFGLILLLMIDLLQSSMDKYEACVESSADIQSCETEFKASFQLALDPKAGARAIAGSLVPLAI